MRRITLAVTVALSLSLVSCSTSEDSDNTAGTITAAAEPSPGEEASSEESGEDSGEVELNEPFEISTLDDNDVYLNISEITIGKECKFGVYTPEYLSDDLGDENQYLQILAEVDVQKLDNPRSGGMVFLSDPKFVDSEGFTATASLAYDCQPGEGYENWSTPTEPGDKSRRYGAFIIPSGTTEIRLEGKTYAVK